jgi:hypothetical protein
MKESNAVVATMTRGIPGDGAFREESVEVAIGKAERSRL